VAIALLEHAAGTVGPAFNADFYVTTASVIPVLFLALTVQGEMYGQLLATASRAARSFATGKRVPLAGFAAFIAPVWRI
jgi:hypothetical protein